MRIFFRPALLILALFICGETAFSQWFQGKKSGSPYWRDNERYQVVMEQIQEGLAKRIPQMDSWSKELPPSRNPQDGSDQPEKMEHFFRKALHQLIHQDPSFPTQKDRYLSFLENLRKALSTSYYQKNSLQESWKDQTPPPLIQIAHELVTAMYNDVGITNYANQLVGQMSEAGGKNQIFPQVNNSPLEDRLTALEAGIKQLPLMYEGIENAPSSLKTSSMESTGKKLRGALSFIEFDPAMEGNLPTLKYEATGIGEGNGGLLKCVRMGTPTIGSDCNARINPEFQAYIRALKNQGKTHTYINFQDGQKPSGMKFFGIEDERPRVQCLQNFSLEEAARDTLIMITLPKNNDWYYQEGKPHSVSKMSSISFLEDMMKKMFDQDDSGFYFPPAWKKKESLQRLQVQALLHNILVVLFNGKNELSVPERQNFIEYAYLLISHFASQGSSSCNKTCKDGIDRAGGASALDHLFLTVLSASDKKVSDEDFNKNLTSLGGMIFADALLTQYREIKKDRLERFVQTAQDLLEKVRKNPDILQQLKKLTPFHGVSVPLNPKQKVTDLNTREN